ncbi:MAG: response regulator [Lachnospiraceae bacterium]|nr:response regulator [Lachnospiraceae bacterium]
MLDGLKILAAEDNALNAEILEFMLNEGGAEVKLVENGLQEVLAFEKSKSGAFDLILTDVMMPVLNGYEASEKIRAMERPDAKTIPIIGISANVFAEDIERGVQAGMDGYVTKPIDPEHLKETIERILQEKKNKK